MEKKIRLTDLHRENIRNVRKGALIRTDILSSMINKGGSYISQIESGRIKTITLEDLSIIADALGCDVSILLEDKEDIEEISRYDKLMLENIELRKENEYLKKKLKSIMTILDM